MTLEEANQRLMERRAAANIEPKHPRERLDRASKQVKKQPKEPTEESRSAEPVMARWLEPLQKCDTSPARSAENPPDKSQSVYKASTNVHKTSTKESTENLHKEKCDTSPYGSADSMPDKAPETINIYSGMITSLLKTKQTAGGRVWLVLRARHAHEGASGKVSRAELKKTLESEFKVSWRRLQQIIEAGEGLFWTWGSEGNLYIHGAKRVARALGIKRLRGDRVTIALSDLTGSYKRAKATLWAAFHAGRGNNDPISRAAQHEIMNVSERSQRQYSAENPDLIETKSNYSIDESHSAESAENHTFEHGKSSFKFTDYNGNQGRAGAQYRARQLPSTHVSKLATAPKGRTRKINKKLRTDRVNKVERGNSCEKIERRYYPNGAAAAKAANRGNVGAQWRTSSTSKKDGLWSRI